MLPSIGRRSRDVEHGGLDAEAPSRVPGGAALRRRTASEGPRPSRSRTCTCPSPGRAGPCGRCGGSPSRSPPARSSAWSASRDRARACSACRCSGSYRSRPRPQVRGAARVCGIDMVTADAEERRLVRKRHLGAVFQDPMTSLNPTMRGRSPGRRGGRLGRRGRPTARRRRGPRRPATAAVPIPTSSPAGCASG